VLLSIVVVCLYRNSLDHLSYNSVLSVRLQYRPTTAVVSTVEKESRLQCLPHKEVSSLVVEVLSDPEPRQKKRERRSAQQKREIASCCTGGCSRCCRSTKPD
jgi:hypothetical protein